MRPAAHEARVVWPLGPKLSRIRIEGVDTSVTQVSSIASIIYLSSVYLVTKEHQL